ncbi:energy transducer TonB [Granulicella arctica]|uniref:TonB family protein n=1 Tax=Granulicella arctica TaxID=940613 RepID=A0A7Y9TRJ3_9BACT|nr:energy transducer TonB [Granulicella arctica]NYF78253.1 TonB family protein [Granulicella arctica]
MLVLTLASPLALHAQSTEADLQSRLIGKPLYLRGSWREDKLHFDGSGKLLGTSDLRSFTLCGVDVTKVHLKNDKLLLDAKRVGLELKETMPKRVVLQVGTFHHLHDEDMQITIDLPQGGDYGAALDAIFADGLADLTPSLPTYWQPYAHKTFLPANTLAPTAQITPSTQQPPKKVGGAFEPPQLLKSADPIFSDAAHNLKYPAVILIGLIVEADGSASNLSLEKPAGLGLDEQALYAVRKYTFKPATENSVPVRVSLTIAVNFQIY